LRQLVAAQILRGDLPHFNVNHLTSSGERDAILRFITDQHVNADVYALAKGLCEGSWPTVLLLRGFLGFGILGIAASSAHTPRSLTNLPEYILREKRFRVTFGLDNKRSMLAVPYIAKV
jgi:hypothetical protein